MLRPRHPASRTALVAATLVWAVVPAIAGDTTVRVIAKTGDPAPVPYSSLVFGFEFFPQIFEASVSASGGLATSATLGGPGVDENNDDIFVLGPPGSLRVFGRAGDQAPGLPAGVLIDQLALAQVNPSGRAIVPVLLRGDDVTTTNDAALYLESSPPGGPPIPVLRSGDDAPGIPDVTIATILFFESAIADTGEVAAVCLLAGDGLTTANNQAVLRSAPGSPATMQLLARAGDQVPGQEPGVNYGAFAASWWTPSGDLYLRSTLAGPAVTAATDTAFLLFPGGNSPPTVLVREGVSVGPQSFSTLYIPQPTNAHEMMFFGRMGTTLSALFVGPVGTGPFRIAAPTGLTPTGLPAGVALNVPNLAKFQFNAARRAAFVSSLQGASVTSANDTALFSEGPLGLDNPILLAREGSPAPGVAAPTVMGSLSNAFATVSINARNQTAFFGVLAGTGITADNDNALWVADDSGAVTLLAREGDPITLSPGDTRIIARLGYRFCSNCARPNAQWFTDDGEIICTLAFTDGTGALVLFEVDPPCRGDFNGDGSATLQDLFDYLGAWFALDPGADVNGSGSVTLQDLFDYLGAWFGGC